MNPIHQCIKKNCLETIFLTEIKGHNSDNNRWILSVIELDLYFLLYTLYLCMRYESNTHMYSKDIARKPFFVLDIHTGQDVRTVRTGRTDKGNAICPIIKNGGGIKTHTIYTFYKCWLKQYTLFLAQN